MSEPTRYDVDMLVGPATPHFAYQLRARVRELVADLPADHDVRRYAEEKIELPFVMGVMADLSGNTPGTDKVDIEQRKMDLVPA